MNKLLVIILSVIVGTVLLTGCVGDSNTQQTLDTEALAAQAVGQVGMPSVTNFAEMRQLKAIYELRDKNIPTYIYLEAMDGQLICLGTGFGYGLPLGVQYTPPTTGGSAPRPLREPNMLFMPDSAEATWYMMKNPKTGDPGIGYFEPRLIILPFELPCRHLRGEP